MKPLLAVSASETWERFNFELDDRSTLFGLSLSCRKRREAAHRDERDFHVDTHFLPLPLHLITYTKRDETLKHKKGQECDNGGRQSYRRNTPESVASLASRFVQQGDKREKAPASAMRRFSTDGDDKNEAIRGISGSGLGMDDEKSAIRFLPAVTTNRSAEHRRQYVWDGEKLRALSVEDVEMTDQACMNLDPKIYGDGWNRLGTSSGQYQAKPSFEILSSRGLLLPPKIAAKKIRRSITRRFQELKASFFPNPASVTPDYWSYARWRASHRFFSSMSSVFATQSLLLAVGVGARRSLPAAAAINWVLKDGLGRLGRLTVAAHFGESFDSDLKRFRFASSLVYAAALTIDFLTPLAPRHFLPMAAAANVGKSVGLTTYISTQPAFLRSFAKSENIADIAAKAQAQQMGVDTIGLAIAITLSALCRNSEGARRTLPLLSLPFLLTGDLISIYKELNAIHLRTLNRERAEIILSQWTRTKSVPSPREVSARERMVLPPDAALGVLPLTLGGLEEALTSQAAVDEFVSQQMHNKTSEPSKYVFTIDPIPIHRMMYREHWLGGRKRAEWNAEQYLAPGHHDSWHTNMGLSSAHRELSQFKYTMKLLSKTVRTWREGLRCRGGLRVALRQDASASDVLEALMAAELLRQRYQREIILQDAEIVTGSVVKGIGLSTVGASNSGEEITRAGRNAPEVWRQWRDQSIASAKKNMPLLLKQLQSSGWQVEPFMLSSKEKRMYELIP